MRELFPPCTQRSVPFYPLFTFQELFLVFWIFLSNPVYSRLFLLPTDKVFSWLSSLKVCRRRSCVSPATCLLVPVSVILLFILIQEGDPEKADVTVCVCVSVSV